jgi:hypothetical protein
MAFFAKVTPCLDFWVSIFAFDYFSAMGWRPFPFLSLNPLFLRPGLVAPLGAPYGRLGLGEMARGVG